MTQGPKNLGDASEKLRALIAGRRFALVINIAAMVLLSISVFQWQQRIAFTTKSSGHFEDVGALNSAVAPTQELEVILDAMLFGRAEENGLQAQLPPISSLDLVLNGVMAAHTGGSAMIAVKGQPQQAFAVGEEVLPGVALAAVLHDRALLKRGGMLESLFLEGADDALIFSVGAASASSPRVQSRSRDNDATRFVLSRETLRSQVQSPQELLSQAMVVPNSSGGFTLQEIESGSLIEQFGLRSGDVILSANGQALRSTDDIMRAYRGLQGTSQVKLEVSRDGRRVQHLYEIH